MQCRKNWYLEFTHAFHFRWLEGGTEISLNTRIAMKKNCNAKFTMHETLTFHMPAHLP